MNLHTGQAEIARDTHRFRVVDCGRRWGKTTLAIEEIKGKAISKSRKIAYIAPTYQQARDIAWQMLKSEFAGSAKNINESRLEIEVPTQDGKTSMISLRGWENIDNLRGQSFDFIVIDEVAMMRNFWESWQEVVRPTLTDRKGEVLFISTPKGFNHFYELYNLERKDDDYKSYHFTSYDNPFIPREEIDKAAKEITTDRFAQEYMADFRKMEGLVYKEFDRDRHLIDDKTPLPEFIETILGVDFGYTNPSALIPIKKDGDANYWILDEWYKTKQSNAQITEKAKSFNPNIVYPDPNKPDSIEEMRDAGLNIREVNKGKGSIENGIQVVRELFKQNRLHIHKRCINLINELETYAYPDSKPDKNEDEVPIKDNDHAMDALRYALMTNAPNLDVLEDDTWGSDDSTFNTDYT